MVKVNSTLELLGGGPYDCAGGTCPALYRDKSGKLFVQGAKLTPAFRDGVAVADNEEIVELTPELLVALKAYQQ